MCDKVNIVECTHNNYIHRLKAVCKKCVLSDITHITISDNHNTERPEYVHRTDMSHLQKDDTDIFSQSAKFFLVGVIPMQ